MKALMGAHIIVSGCMALWPKLATCDSANPMAAAASDAARLRNILFLGRLWPLHLLLLL